MVYATYDFYLLIKYRYRIDIAIFWQYRIDIVSNSKNQYRCITNTYIMLMFVGRQWRQSTEGWIRYSVAQA